MGTRIITGDCRSVLATLPAESVQCCVTSPPYFGLRDYGVAGQIGLEATPEEYVGRLVQIFAEVRCVLKPDGVLFLNLGDSYASGPSGNIASSGLDGGQSGQEAFRLATANKRVPLGLKPKDLMGIPWRVAFALQADGWWLRQDIIWSKLNPMPESVTDRCTKAHEYIFMLTKSARYFYDAAAIAEDATYPNDDRKGRAAEDHKRMPTEDVAGIRPRSDKQRGHGRRHAGFNDHWDAMERAEQCSGKRNKRSVWEIATSPFPDAHFATFPPALVEPCIRAGSKEGDTILDPFGGAGTVGLVADRWKRNAILIELNPAYAAMAERRIHNDAPLFAETAA